MSEFMRNVVAEVLQRNKTEHKEPCTADGKDSCSAGCGQPEACTKQAAAIKRVNYQRERAAQRLAPIAGQTGAGSSARASFPAQQAVAAVAKAVANPITTKPGTAETQMTKRFVEDTLSPLLRLTIGGQGSIATDVAPPTAEAGIPEVASPIGRGSGAGSSVWFFPSIREELRPLLGAVNRKFTAAGVVSIERCLPSQLFAIEEVLGADPQLEAQIDWGRTGKGFELKLFGSDADSVAAKLSELSERLSGGNTDRRFETCFSATPSRLLAQHLELRHNEAAAVLEGVAHWDGVGLMDRFLQQHPDSRVRFQVKDGYVLLTGTAEDALAAVAELKQDASRLLGSR